jgi:predicted nucleic acid-binding protein
MDPLAKVFSSIEEFFQTIQISATILEAFPELFAYARDPDDAHYVNLALAADAKLIV